MQQRRAPLGALPAPGEYADELYLCTACARGRRDAIELLEQRYFPALKAALRPLSRQPHQLQEVLQEVRGRLLVGPSPKIATYRGDGPLSSWLRSIAVRAALDHLRARKSRSAGRRKFAEFHATCVANDTAAATDAAAACGFESDSPRVIWRAWSAAVRALEPQQRRLLQQYVVSELSIDVLASVYLVHRATVARRIQRAKKQVREHVLKMLSTHYRDTSGRELELLALDACLQLDIAASFECEPDSVRPACSSN